MAKRTNKVKRRDMKFMWLSNALYTNSGYAVETRDLLKRFKSDGWDVAQIANHGIESYHTEIDCIRVYPRMGDANGTDAILYHAKHFGAEVVFVMLDYWILNPQYLEQAQREGIKIIPWIPIDQEPVNPGILHNLKFSHKVLTFSNYGKKALQKSSYASTMIYEGIDTNVFKPMDKSVLRKEIGIPQDAFLFGMIGANKENPPRKGYQQALDAFKMFQANHPNSYMFFHCQQIGAGFPIHEYASYLGLKNILYLDQYRASYLSDSSQIAKEINTFDVLLHPSMTEGFGMLSIEAQACGVPVIINRCTSMPELVKENETGWICETDHPWWRNAGGYVYPANVNSLHEKMEELHEKLQDDKEKDKISKACRENVLTNFNIDTIVKKDWIPFLEKLQEELLGKENG